jgi:hypothetical protein
MERIASASYGPGNIGIHRETLRNGRVQFVVTRENLDGEIISRFGVRRTEDEARILANHKWADWRIPRAF